MAFFSSMRSELIGVYDNELSVALFTPTTGQIYGRDSLQNVHHAKGSPEDHPTLPNIIKNTNGHVFFKGSYQFEWEWNSGEVTEVEMDSYIAEVSSAIVNPSVSFTKDVVNNKLIMNMTSADMQVTGWTGQLVQWHPKAPKALIRSLSDDCEFVCVTRLNNTYNEYTFDQTTIEPGQSLEIQRPDCTLCYVMFSDHVVKDTAVLLGKKMYKMSSQTLTVTNNQTERVRVLRYYR
jgi:hypothetical protein